MSLKYSKEVLKFSFAYLFNIILVRNSFNRNGEWNLFIMV